MENTNTQPVIPSSSMLADKKLMPLGDLFKESFEHYKLRIQNMIWLSVMGFGASLVILLVFGSISGIIFIATTGLAAYLSAILIALVGLLGIIIVGLWMQTALMYAIKENPTIKAKDLFIIAKSNMSPYFWVIFLKSLAVTAGLMLFIVPGIIFSVWFSGAGFAFIFDGKKGSEALSYSKSLVKGYWWPIFGRLVLLGIISAMISSIQGIGFFINMLFVMPFGIVYVYTIYEDLKKIKTL